MEQKEELNYPVMYGIMPIEEVIGVERTPGYLQPKYGLVANIVSKCYVVGQHKEYSNTGVCTIKYEIVFMHTKKDPHHSDFENTVPDYDSCYGYMNSDLVDEIFGSFEEAYKVAEEKNDGILKSRIAGLSLESDIDEAVKDHEATLQKYRKIEDSLEQAISDIKVSSILALTLEHIIERISENPSDFYAKLAERLSIEEREYLKHHIDTKCSNCTNPNCRIDQSEKVGLDDSGKPQGSDCFNWDNKELIGRQLVLEKNN